MFVLSPGISDIVTLFFLWWTIQFIEGQNLVKESSILFNVQIL